MSGKSILKYKDKFDAKRISQYFQQIKKMFSKEKLANNNKLEKSQYKASSSFDIPRYRVFRRYGDLTLKQVRDKTIEQNLQMARLEDEKKSFSVKKINMPVGLKKANEGNKIKNTLKIRRNSKSKQLVNYSPSKQSCSLLVFSKQRQLTPFANKIERFRTDLLNKNLLIKQPHQAQIPQHIYEEQPQPLDKNVIKCRLKSKTSVLKRNLCKNRLCNQKKSQQILDNFIKDADSKFLSNNTPGTLGPWIKYYENPQF